MVLRFLAILATVQLAAPLPIDGNTTTTPLQNAIAQTPPCQGRESCCASALQQGNDTLFESCLRDADRPNARKIAAQVDRRLWPDDGLRMLARVLDFCCLLVKDGPAHYYPCIRAVWTVADDPKLRLRRLRNIQELELVNEETEPTEGAVDECNHLHSCLLKTLTDTKRLCTIALDFVAADGVAPVPRRSPTLDDD